MTGTDLLKKHLVHCLKQKGVGSPEQVAETKMSAVLAMASRNTKELKHMQLFMHQTLMDISHWVKTDFKEDRAAPVHTPPQKRKRTK